MRGSKITINPRYAFWLAPFMSKSDWRPQLCGITIEPRKKGCLLIATDGHVLGIVYDPKASAKKRLVWKPSDSLIKRGKSADRTDDNEQVHLIDGLGEDIGEPLFEIAPFLKKVKKPVAPKRLKFNPELMARFRNVCGGKGAVMQPTGDGEAAIITSSYRPEFFGLIMPMHVPDAPAWQPWLGRAPK